jgi:transposase
MKKHITFVGLDVHKNSIDVALADGGRDGEVRFHDGILVGFIRNMQVALKI